MTTLNGIDVSGHQTTATLNEWLPKVDFVIVKASEGKGYKSKTWAEHVKLARDAGKLVGHYHYAWPENGAAADAANFLSVIGKLPAGEVVVLDYEPWATAQPNANPKTFARYIIEFADIVKKATGRMPWLYSNDYWLNVLENNASPSEMDVVRRMPLWKAGNGNAYVSSPLSKIGDLHGWDSAICWQWTDKPLDQNVFYGNAALWKGQDDTVVTPPQPDPEPTTVDKYAKATWRGVVVCKHSAVKYDAWAKAVGNDILLKPLPGCGSYQTTTAASAGTHAGGGAIDIDTRGYTMEQRDRIERTGRQAGLQIAWERNAISGLWTWHVHAIDPDCPTLSKAAVSQVVEFGKGGDGLVGDKPDPGDRSNVTQLMFLFVNRLKEIASVVANTTKVKFLQQATHQKIDGVWGEQTDIALRHTGSEATRNYNGTFFKSKNTWWRKKMQESWGAYVDGVWGPNTKSSAVSTVKNIQKTLGVPVDGVWGPQTSAAYFEFRSKMYKGTYPAKFPAPDAAPSSGGGTSSGPNPYLPTGKFPYPAGKTSMYGPSTSGKPYYSGAVAGSKLTKAQIQSNIRKIQRAVGAGVDGIFGSQTASKVKSYQSKHRLTPDGLVGEKTWGSFVYNNK